jgi:thymidine kinase
MAKFHFKYGAMNSGKSQVLINTAYNYEEKGLDVATIKPAIDTKGDDTIVARGGHERKADILAEPEMDLRREIMAPELGKTALACVLVDESQFLSREQVGQLYKVAKEDDISVIAYGLKTDFRTGMFEGSKRLFELADNIEKLPTMCTCGAQAEFNIRKVGEEYVFEGDQVAIDDSAEISYDSVCGSCYMGAGGQI